jgi:hypothetical protein
VLDLSVNAVAADDIQALAQLPCLKELDISRYDAAAASTHITGRL